MGEVLGALGLAWPRLLLYPGGLAALLAAWLLARWLRLVALPGLPNPILGDPSSAEMLLDLMPPLAALSLLPLPPARAFPYGLDLPTAAVLLAWPRLRALALAGSFEPARLPELGRLLGAHLLAGLLLAEGSGSLELSALLEAPEQGWRWLLLAGGALTWLVSLALLVAVGGLARGPGAALGDLGLLLVGALPLLAGLAALLGERLPEGWAGWLLPPLAALLAAGVAGALLRFRIVARLARGRQMR